MVHLLYYKDSKAADGFNFVLLSALIFRLQTLDIPEKQGGHLG